MKVAFLHKGGSLIYIGISNAKDESVSFLKKQLEFIHCQLISLTTQNLIHTLKSNPSYDVVNDIYEQTHLLKTICNSADKDPGTFLNQFLPLRMHPNTRESIEITIKRYKPESEKYLYGAVLTDKTVVALIKHNPKIIVFPAGKLYLVINNFKRYQPVIQLHQCQHAATPREGALLRQHVHARHDRGIQTQRLLPSRAVHWSQTDIRLRGGEG
jgi:hypothetical protein